MNRDIAIIGMAARFPEAPGIEQVPELFKRSPDLVRELSPKRIKEATLNPERPLRPIGYLEDIDKFDHPLFELSLAEAQVMDPHHRLMLESVYHLFEHAGYSPDDFDGSRTAVFVSDINPEYYRLAEEFPDTMVAGNSPAFAATRISRQFNLTGNAAVIDTACSSSLVAVHMAVSELLLGEADSAIVCGVNLNLQPYRDKQFEFNIWSPDCKSRAFSEDAAGMSCGELVASVLLKPLADAQRDGDTIHAIIKSTAVNNNARRSASPTAPDSISQAGVVRDAWRKAGVDPRQIGYIEAHGSGTKLGDSLEIEGLSAAFRDVTDARGIVPISTIKSSLGHGYNASGIAGLVRAVMALKHRVYFPTLHFERPNSLIDFEQSAVYVNKELREWPQPDGHPRYAGVTSLGASGTNCHVLLQEAPESPAGAAAGGAAVWAEDGTAAGALADRSATGPLPFVVSARTPEALQRRLSQLAARLETMSERELAAVSWTLARGRQHYRCRFAATADTVAGLREQLRAGLLVLSQEGNASADASWRLTLPERGGERAKAILLLTDHAPLPESVVAALQARHPVYRQTYAEVCGSIDSSADNIAEGVRALAHLIAMYRLLEAWQMPVGQLLPVGIGRLAADAIAGRRTLAEAATAAQTYVSEPLQGLAERVAKLIDAETEGGEVLFVELAPGGELGEALRASKRDERSGSLPGRSLGGLSDSANSSSVAHSLSSSSSSASSSSSDSSHGGVSSSSSARRFRLSGLLSAASGDPAAGLLCELYAQGHTPDWRAAYAGGPALRVELPGYPFEPIRCWVRETPQLSMADVMDESGAERQLEQAGALRDPEATELERRIASYWSEALELDELGRDDHFFELGGDSLLATRVIRRIREELAIKLDFEDLFDYPTLRGFAAYIDSLTGPEDKVAAIFREVLKQPQLGPYDSFFELGGHSLMANQVLLRVRAAFGVELNFEEIFLHPTPAELSRYIGDRLAQSPPGDARTSTGEGVAPQSALTQTSSGGTTSSSANAAAGGEITLADSNAYSKTAQPGSAADGGGLAGLIPLAPPQESYPVSAAQKRMWMLSQFPESLIAYNSPFSMVLEGELDKAALAAAFDAVVDRHEVLRTVFGDDQGEPVQLIRDRRSLGIGLELRDAGGDGGQAEAEAWMEADRMQPFDLAAGPLIKAVLFAVEPRRHLLYVNMHHIISDGWSSRVLLRDLAALYNARRQGLPDPLPPLRMQYKDYAQWQAQSIAGGDYDAMGAYWRETLGGELPTLELPLDRPRPPMQTYAGARVRFALSPDELAQLQARCRERGVTLYMALLAATNLVLYKYTGQTDLLIGSPIAGRSRVELEEQLGFYANTIVLRSQIDPTQPLGDLLDRARQATLSAYQHQLYPFDRLVEELEIKRDMSRSPLFNVMLVLQNTDLATNGASPLQGLTLREIEDRGVTSLFDLHLEFVPDGDGLQGALTYKTDLFHRETMEGLADHLMQALEVLAQTPELPLRTIELAERPTAAATLAEHQLLRADQAGGASDGLSWPPTLEDDSKLILADGFGLRSEAAEQQVAASGSVAEAAAQVAAAGSAAAATPLTAEQLGKRLSAAQAETLVVTVWQLAELLAAPSAAASLQRVRRIGLLTRPDELAQTELLARQLAELDADCELIRLCGSQQSGLLTSVSVQAAEAGDGVSSLGRPISGVELIVRDADGRPLPTGVSGQLYWRRAISEDAARTAAYATDDAAAVIEGGWQPTGWLGRRERDGSYRYDGERQRIVRVKGFEVRLDDVERQALALGTLRQARAAMLAVAEGESPRLTLIYTADRELDSDGLKGRLKTATPAYAVPEYYVRLERMPLTATGGLDEQALVREAAAQLTLRPATAADAAPGADRALEETLTHVWRETLGVQRIGRQDHYFEQGGDSIKALRASIRLKKLGYAIELKDLFLYPTVAEMAAHIAASGSTQDEKAAARARELEAAMLQRMEELRNTVVDAWQGEATDPARPEDAYPMSDIEKGLVFHSVANPGTSAHMIQYVYSARYEQFDEAIFLRAFALMADKHPNLRASFHLEHPAEPIKIVHAGAQLDVSLIDLEGLAEARQRSRIEAVMAEENGKPFAFGQAPLWRTRVFRLGESRYLFLFIYHQSIMDGWSNAILMKELSDAYFALLADPDYRPQPLSHSYKQFVLEQYLIKQDERLRDYWREELRGYRRLALPEGADADGFTERETYRYRLEPELLSQAAELATRLGVTLRHLLFAIYARLMSRLTNQDDAVVGILTHNRPACEDGDAMIGFFLNMLPVRTRFAGEESWADYIRRFHAHMVELSAYDKMGLSEIARAIGDAQDAGNPISDTLFNFTDFRESGSVEEQSAATEEPLVESKVNANNTWLDFNVDVSLGRLDLKIDTAVYDRAIIDDAAAFYRETIARLAAEPELRLADIRLRSDLLEAQTEDYEMEFDF